MARKPVEPSERVKKALWLARRAAGSDAQVHRWLKEYPVPKRKVGAPRNTSLDDFLQMIADYHGPHWDQGRMIVPPEDPKVATIQKLVKEGRSGEYIAAKLNLRRASSPYAVLHRYVEREWRHREKMHWDETLPLEVREAYDPKHLGPSIEQVTRRLAKELRRKRRS